MTPIEANGTHSPRASLSEDGQSNLRNLAYSHGQETRDSIPDLIDRYDYILAKYDDLDFLGRKSNGAYSQNILETPKMEVDNAIVPSEVAIIGLSIMAAMSMLGVIYLKKKNERE